MNDRKCFCICWGGSGCLGAWINTFTYIQCPWNSGICHNPNVKEREVSVREIRNLKGEHCAPKGEEHSMSRCYKLMEYFWVLDMLASLKFAMISKNNR